MSRIVKSISVVDDRPPVAKTLSSVAESDFGNTPVIKQRMFNYRRSPYSDAVSVLPDKQGYIDELNRVKIEIAQAKAELRSLGRQVEEAIEQHEEEEASESESESESGSSTLTPMHNILIAKLEADRLIAEAKKKVASMMAECEENSLRMAEEARNNGYLDGFDKGFVEAQNEFKEQYNPKMRDIENLLDQLSNYMEEMIARNERDLLELVMTVSEKIIGREIKEDPRAVVTMLYQVLDQNRREENIRITVSEDLMPAEAKAAAEVKKLIAGTAPNALIYVDEDAEDGYCSVETDKGITDMSVKTQLGNIIDMLSDE